MLVEINIKGKESHVIIFRTIIDACRHPQHSEVQCILITHVLHHSAATVNVGDDAPRFTLVDTTFKAVNLVGVSIIFIFILFLHHHQNFIIIV